MIDSVSISSSPVVPSRLSIVQREQRVRNLIDRKKNYFIFKRLFDVTVSCFFILCILSWLTPLLAILIKLSSRGPVFFLQKRIGFGGKTFTCYKYRTMIPNTESDTRQASYKDERITLLGKFLRKTNIDEFPQFFNIIKGDMSIIGPRPHMYADCKKFSAFLPGYKSRTLVKPGLTGLAQVKGYHGPATHHHTIKIRYHWDTYYIRNIGLLLDVKILLYTLFQRIPSIGKIPAGNFRSYQNGKEEVIVN